MGGSGKGGQGELCSLSLWKRPRLRCCKELVEGGDGYGEGLEEETLWVYEKLMNYVEKLPKRRLSPASAFETRSHSMTQRQRDSAGSCRVR